MVVALAIAIPVMGADPSPSGGPPGQSKPDKSANPNKPRQGRTKAAKAPEVAVTVQGTVTKGTDEKGRPTYSVTANGKTWELSAGPSWYWGDKNPLNAYVGKSVSIAGSTHEGETELDVETVNGTALRAPASRRGPADRGSSARRTPDGSPGWPTASPARATVSENAPGQLKKETATP